MRLSGLPGETLPFTVERITPVSDDQEANFFRVEARLLDSQVRADAWIAYFELEAAVGGFPTAENTGAGDR